MPRTKKKVKSIVKTKVISARVTETVHEFLHQQAEDAGMTLSQFAAQMLMKGRVNTSYVFYANNDSLFSFITVQQQAVKFGVCRGRRMFKTVEQKLIRGNG